MEVSERLFLVMLKAWRVYCEKRHYLETKNMIKKERGNKSKLPKLRKEQKRAVRDIWKNKGRFNYDTHKLVYWATGKFDPKIVPELFVRLHLEPELNNQFQKYAWSDKNMLDQLLPKENLPHTLVRNIDGCLYDSDYNYINAAQAAAVLQKYEQVFFKPAIDSGYGKGADLLQEYSVDLWKGLGSNWVIQEVIKPHEQLKRLNQTAVSIIRMITFYIDGIVYMTSASLRVGMENAITDVTAGRDDGGVFVIGINTDGRLHEYGYYPNGKKMDTAPNGCKFGGSRIPGFEKAKELVQKGHKNFPHCRFIAWDVTVNEAGKPIIVEANMKGPGVLYYQYTNGSLFGSYFQEIYGKVGRKTKER